MPHTNNLFHEMRLNQIPNINLAQPSFWSNNWGVLQKSVGESIEKPMEYYTENLESLLSIIQVANEKNAKSFIFFSSATVYGDTKESCVTEETPLGKPLNP